MGAKVSIVIPVYNIEKYLGRCILSVMKQSYTNLQIIIVDDGSTDGSAILCDFYGRQDSRIEVIHKENGGLVSARKAGLSIAKGEYIGFVDGDDWIEIQTYEHLVNIAEEHQADMVLGGKIEDVENNTVKKLNWLKQGVYNKERLHKEVYPFMLCARDFFCMGIQPYLWNKLMRREVAYECVMAVDDRIRVGEDVAAVLPMLLMANRIVITNHCDYHYCIRRTSIMWENGNEEREWKELRILHYFLKKVLVNRMRLENAAYQLGHYTVGNMLVRTFGKIAEWGQQDILWPFAYHIGSKQCIVYGAGHFGRAVYGYLHNCYQNIVKLWVDREFLLYQSMGLPVYGVEEIPKEQDVDILIAVLDMELAEVIRENLIQLGVCREQIHCIKIAEEDVNGVLEKVKLDTIV